MSNKYKILCTVELLHDYYANNASRDFAIVPSAETIEVLRGHKMLTKATGNRLVVLVKVSGDDKVFSLLPIDFKLTFYLVLKNPYFYNITNIHHQPLKVYYFSNSKQNEVDSNLYITTSIANYDSAVSYNVGDFADNGSGQIFEAIKPSSNADDHATTESEFWRLKGDKQIVTKADWKDVAGSTYLFNSASNTDFNVRIFKFNAQSGTFDLQVKKKEQLKFEVARTSVPIDLTSLPAGEYRIEVNGEGKQIYVDTVAANEQVFGIIEMMNHLESSNAFSLLDTDSKPKSNNYIIRFSNRAVVWKYYARTTDVTALNDAEYTFSSTAAKQFLSNVPIPFTEKPTHALTAETSSIGTIKFIGYPASDRLNRVDIGGVEYLVAEKFLNY